MIGYLILKKDASGYRGIDREHFEPTFIDSLIDKSITKFEYIWQLYSKGWRQSLYKKIEENSIIIEGTYFLKEEKTAFEVLNHIPNTEGDYEVIKVEIYLKNQNNIDIILSNNFLGFDIAYLGGDSYSAVKNGLVINPKKYLYHKYGNYLNEYYLFSEKMILSDYLTDFKKVVLSESNSDFFIYVLSLCYL